MAPSIYEELRAHDNLDDPYDLEERAGMALDEENLGRGLGDYDLEGADVFDQESSQVASESTHFTERRQGKRKYTDIKNHLRKGKDRTKTNSHAESPRILEDEGDDDVPASLLIEGDEEAGPRQPGPSQTAPIRRPSKAVPLPGRPTREARAQWSAAQSNQRLHHEDHDQLHLPVVKPSVLVGTPRERALWTWLNATNMDHFMGDVYEYYRGAGIWCICFDRFLGLL
jgi:autophagy-related protein 9